MLDRIRWVYDQQRFRHAVATTDALTVPREAGVEVHMLVCRRTVYEAVACLHSLYRFLRRAERAAVTFHDDGTLGTPERAFLSSAVPNARIIDRRTADAHVEGDMASRGMRRCITLRRNHVFARKLFDPLFFGGGKSIICLDSDILFFARPEAALTSLDEALIRFNEDVHSSYTWDDDVIRDRLGIELTSSVNAGLVITPVSVQRGWEVYEDWLARLPEPEPRRAWYIEQTLTAVACSAFGGVPLPSEYDVCFRHAWDRSISYEQWLPRARTEGHRVVSQHYCGGPKQRAAFFNHFCEHVAPRLRAAARSRVLKPTLKRVGSARMSDPCE